NYIYPRMVHIYIDEISKLTSLNVVGFDFKPLGCKDFKDTIKDIYKQKPDAIINLINGTSNGYFFEQLYEIDKGKKIPVFSTSLDENGISNIDSKYIDGHYGAWNYFNSLNNEKNKKLKELVKKRYGEDFKITDAGYETYLAFELYIRALLESKDNDMRSIKKSIKMDSLDTAMGIVYVDMKNNHIHKNIKIGKIKDGDYSIVWSSKIINEPNPYPEFKTKDFWIGKELELKKEFLNGWQSDKAYGSFR
ncbi:MAG: transporter substrate-binding protein, partial [Campylobacterales bacterium]|nr:transporter substrate-binding protein [Campylobacterales bacterium]